MSWTAGGGGRQLIHLDAQTHAQLQQMNPQQRAMFVAQLQKRRQLSIQRAQAQALVHQQVNSTYSCIIVNHNKLDLFKVYNPHAVHVRRTLAIAIVSGLANYLKKIILLLDYLYF